MYICISDVVCLYIYDYMNTLYAARIQTDTGIHLYCLPLPSKMILLSFWEVPVQNTRLWFEIQVIQLHVLIFDLSTDLSLLWFSAHAWTYTCFVHTHTGLERAQDKRLSKNDQFHMYEINTYLTENICDKRVTMKHPPKKTFNYHK